MYKTCGSSINEFSEQMQLLMSNVKHNKTVFLCGDINIDLLKYGSDNNTTHYVDTMFSLGLYSLIDKPTRITAHSSTLIDNIFTNELNYNIDSGILINDISDHLPIFAICKYCDISRTMNPKFKFNRKINLSSINAFKNSLALANLDNVTFEEDVNVAYNNFVDTFC